MTGINKWAVTFYILIHTTFIRLYDMISVGTRGFTFLGQTAAPTSGNTVAPPAATSLIWNIDKNAKRSQTLSIMSILSSH